MSPSARKLSLQSGRERFISFRNIAIIAIMPLARNLEFAPVKKLRAINRISGFAENTPTWEKQNREKYYFVIMANGREVVPFYACVSELTSKKGTFLSHFSLFFCFSTRLFVSLLLDYGEKESGR